MNLLLDTHILLWWLSDPEKLTPEVRSLIRDGNNTVYVSSVVAWEIAIKKSLGKLKAPDNLGEIIREENFTPLNITVSHALNITSLENHHADPFDRMLVSQAQIESLTIVTRDANISKYPVTMIRG